MTGITLVGTINVRRRFSSRDGAVMARHARAHGFVVIDGSNRHPSRIDMTGFAHVAGQNMGSTLTGGNRAIVTSDAGIRCGRMIKRTHKPVSRGVADVTGRHCRHMGRTLTNGNNTIVTRFTGAQHLTMIN